ncbi:hypothetical protein ABQF17_17950 [Mycolicibacterium elephantis]
MTTQQHSPAAQAQPSTTPPPASGPDVQAGDPSPGSTDEHQPSASELGDHDDPNDDEQDDGVTGEARKYRKRAQKAERERDDAHAQLAALQQWIVDGIAAAPLAGHPELLTAAGHDLSEFITDDGTVDAEKVRAAATEAARTYNIIPKGRQPAPVMQQGTNATQPHGKSSWNTALKRSE